MRAEFFMQSYKWRPESAAHRGHPTGSISPRWSPGSRSSAQGSDRDQRDPAPARYGIRRVRSSRALVARPIAQMRHLDSHRRTRAQESCILWTVILSVYTGCVGITGDTKFRDRDCIRQVNHQFSLDKNYEYLY